MSTPTRRQSRPAVPVAGNASPQHPSKDAPQGAPASARRPRNGSPHVALPAPFSREDMPQRADATREKLLIATHELLRERVGSPVSVYEICARAGANVAMV